MVIDLDLPETTADEMKELESSIASTTSKTLSHEAWRLLGARTTFGYDTPFTLLQAREVGTGYHRNCQ
jgi:hypothetical protein